MADPRPTPSGPAAPGGPLILRGGGITGVETDEMAAGAAALGRMEHELEALRHRIAAVPSARAAAASGPLLTVPVGPDALAALDARGVETASALRAVATRAVRVREAILTCARRYAEAEDAATWLMQNLAQSSARTLGALAGTQVVAMLFGAAAGAFLAWVLTPGTREEKSARLAIWMREHPELVTSPEFVAVVRCISLSVDDFVAGARGSGFSGPWIPRPGTPGGVESGADTVLAAGALVGLFRESRVRADRVRTDARVVPPDSIAERLRRVPEEDQVRIEKYAAPGYPPHWVVYVDPTETFTPAPTSEPWDLTSNVAGVAGRSSGSLRATEAAMADAGVKPGDPVAFVGFSQGGLVAATLAGSGRWNTRGLETFGAPVGNIPLPDTLPGMQVRHTDDFVPALAGPDLPSTRLLVEQRAFSGEIPTHRSAPAHQRDSYDRTAAVIDASGSPQVRAQLDTMRRFTSAQAALPGATSEAYTYRAVRTDGWHPAVQGPLVPRAYAASR